MKVAPFRAIAPLLVPVLAQAVVLGRNEGSSFQGIATLQLKIFRYRCTS